MQSSEPIGASKVIARANPIILGTGWMLLGAGLLLHIRVLDKYGWRNPEAFVGLPSSRHAWFYDIAFIGHAIAASLALLLAVVTFKLALPAIRGFNDVIVENGRLHYASRPWMGKSAVSDISARVVPSYQGGLLFRSDNLEIVHVVRRPSGRKPRIIRLKSLYYFETAQQMAANLEACGVEVRGRPPEQSAPIWERSADG
ncbi:hypothetical protein GGQ61_001094 [Phenylobacterium haematophilum]|uniref:Uncharacterized protein n=1 Tax=Phenylobacterium haematophilum TaxID=98513 RepID=A0A839ZZ39_9CAUL|nr:hypothetical protein [Phenylobacterium haematophilum]MBB3890397.1 hypothetical protein [Phenylobacterium haematophilum]